MKLASVASLAPMGEQSAVVLFRFRNEVLEIGVSCRQGGSGVSDKSANHQVPAALVANLLEQG